MARTGAGPGRNLAKADYETLAGFRYLLRRFAIFSEQAARRAGLTAQQHQVLLAVRGFPGRERVAIGELAERLGLRNHSATGLVNRLVKRGLLRRRADRRDRRRVMVEVTARAGRQLARLSAAHRAELGRLAPLLRTLLDRIAPGTRRAARRAAR
ncbi:MAG TPA: MarR family transcriptional regulator [Steroidobacteraceae bacterium]|jgi:DNA-binding MarR family transcriptional regulator|nr:MarR family transcriptional regulator [Steroidobacteraceae bacterium]